MMAWIGSLNSAENDDDDISQEEYDPEEDIVDDEDAELAEDAEELEEQNKSLLRILLSQLRPGMGLDRFTLPTFLLEPRSLLEKLTDFMAHPDLLYEASQKTDPVERFVGLVRWYLSGFHVRPKGVKKPYNPILGEVFVCRWENDEQGAWRYVSEQVSHHPPISAFYVENRKAQVAMNGSFRPKSKFLGMSAAAISEGETEVNFLAHGEKYTLNWPSVYAKGILVGALTMEMGGHVHIACAKTGLECNIEFKRKGWVRGDYHSIKGVIKRTGDRDKHAMYALSGHWNAEMFITDAKKKKTETFIKANRRPIRPTVESEADQHVLESRRLWHRVTLAVKDKDMDEATAGKTYLEEAQRRGRKKRKDESTEWRFKWFDGEVEEGVFTYRNAQTKPFTAAQIKEPVPRKIPEWGSEVVSPFGDEDIDGLAT